MLFNSFSFFLFLPTVFILYWVYFNTSVNKRNLLLISASYYFYANWDWRFLFLLIFSTLLDFYSGLKISEARTLKFKKIWLWISITINLGLLLVFKYYNFFIDSFNDVLSFFHFQEKSFFLEIILPVGISFYTFHGLSYVIDIYNNRILPERNFVTYSLFVCFFPLLIAGPIERATHLLPQLKKAVSFNYELATEGLRQILWGFLKKVVIADQCAEQADLIFNNYHVYSGSTLFFGALFFTIQIYCDFSGYTDIATGTAKLFGFRLLRNFNYPYFSRSIAEFWRRWHISLSSWFKDYLYIPLGGSRHGIGKTVRNTIIIFVISGFWHGANWTFIAWGLLNAFYILPSILIKTNRENLEIVAHDRSVMSPIEAMQMLRTFLLVLIAWIFFRSESIQQAIEILSRIISVSLFSKPTVMRRAWVVLAFALAVFILEWIGRRDEFAIQRLGIYWPKMMRRFMYYFLFILIVYFLGAKNAFIYFQF